MNTETEPETATAEQAAASLGEQPAAVLERYFKRLGVTPRRLKDAMAGDWVVVYTRHGWGTGATYKVSLGQVKRVTSRTLQVEHVNYFTNGNAISRDYDYKHLSDPTPAALEQLASDLEAMQAAQEQRNEAERQRQELYERQATAAVIWLNNRQGPEIREVFTKQMLADLYYALVTNGKIGEVK